MEEDKIPKMRNQCNCTSVQADGPEEEEKTITRGLSWKRWEKKAKEDSKD